MRNFQHEELREIRRKLNQSNGHIFVKYPVDSTALFVYGFNQISRDYLERDYYNQKIEGNIVTFEIDTIGKRLRLRDYSTVLKN